MADTAAHLVDRVLPVVPVRQWVLSLPFALRYRLAYDAPLASAVLGLFVRAVFASLRRRARSHAVDVLECPRCGSRTRILAAIHPPDTTRAILECLALPSRAPPAAAARPDDDDEGGPRSMREAAFDTGA